ncbi:hypothetical protein J6590_095249 [Homalodisca vitripennis]|nr:hypothetical protein J6590_095249 [Homalodisca vitripennis]
MAVTEDVNVESGIACCSGCQAIPMMEFLLIGLIFTASQFFLRLTTFRVFFARILCDRRGEAHRDALAAADAAAAGDAGEARPAADGEGAPAALLNDRMVVGWSPECLSFKTAIILDLLASVLIDGSQERPEQCQLISPLAYVLYSLYF